MNDWLKQRSLEAWNRVERWKPIAPFLVVGLVFVLGLLIRCYGISTRGFWWDEAALWHDALTGHRNPDEAPLNTWAALGVMSLLRRNDSVALHVAAVGFGALAILAAYWLGKVVAGTRCGIFSSVLIAVSPTLIGFSQEARPYSLLILLTILQLAAAIQLSKQWAPRTLALLMCLTCAALATHLVALPFTLGVGLVLICSILLKVRQGSLSKTDGWRRVAVLLIAAVPSMVTGLAWTLFRPSFSSVMTGHYRYGIANFIRTILTECGPSFYASNRPWGASEIIVGIYVLLAIIGAIALWRHERRIELACLLVPAIALPAALFLQLGEKSAWPWFRYATPVVAPVLILVAAGMTAHRRWIVSIILFGLVLETNLYPSAGLQAWAASAPNTRGYRYVQVANEVYARRKLLSGVIVVRQTSAFGDETDRLSASYAYYRKDRLPAFFAGVQDRKLYEIEYRKSVGAIEVPVRTSHLATSLPAGNYAVFYGWDVARGCSTLSPLLEDPKPPVKALNFIVCSAARK